MMPPFTSGAMEAFDQLVFTWLNTTKKIQHRTSKHCRGNEIQLGCGQSIQLDDTHPPSQVTGRCLQVVPSVIYLQTSPSFASQSRKEVVETTQIVATNRSPACFQTLHLKTSISSWQVDPLAHELVEQPSRPQEAVEQKQPLKCYCMLGQREAQRLYEGISTVLVSLH